MLPSGIDDRYGQHVRWMVSPAPKVVRHVLTVRSNVDYGGCKEETARVDRRSNGAARSPCSHAMLPFIITGLVTGAVYGLAAVGLVLTYKTSGIFNFAHGALATVGAYAFYELFVQSEWSWGIAAAVVVLVLAPLIGLALELMARRLDGASIAMRVACTVGLLIAVQAAIILHYGTLESRIVPNFLSQGSFKIGETVVTGSQLITVIFALVSTAGLYAFFRVARQGKAMRAV